MYLYNKCVELIVCHYLSTKEESTTRPSFISICVSVCFFSIPSWLGLGTWINGHGGHSSAHFRLFPDFSNDEYKSYEDSFTSPPTFFFPFLFSCLLRKHLGKELLDK